MPALSFAPFVEDRESLYALSWTYAQDGKIAADADSGVVLDVNPAIEALLGYSRAELIGMPMTVLHPEDEHERARAEFVQARYSASLHSGFHVQCKDGSTKPVAIWSSEPLVLDGQNVAIAEIRDITDQEHKEHQLSAQNWALSAFSIAALALGRARTEEGLLQSICEAITAESVYALAWVGIAEEGPE